MVDAVSLSIALGAIIVSILAHIKASKCGSCSFTTRTPPTTPINNDFVSINRVNNTM
jgi:hypothetical protein